MGRGTPFQIRVLKGNHNHGAQSKTHEKEKEAIQTAYGAALAQIKPLCSSEVLNEIH